MQRRTRNLLLVAGLMLVTLLGLTLLLLFRGAGSAEGAAGEPADVELSAPAGEDVLVAGFRLAQRTTVAVEAVGRKTGGAGRRWIWDSLGVNIEEDTGNPEAELAVTAWILDAATRQPVWMMTADSSTAVPRSLALRHATASLDLAAGAYEVYLASLVSRIEGPDRGKLVPLLSRLGGGDPDRNEDLSRCRVALRLPADRRAALTRFEVTGSMPGSLLGVTRNGDRSLRSAGFVMEKPGRLRVVTLFERASSWPAPADTAWILDAATREHVWEVGDNKGSHAGGSRKNRRIDEEVELPAGAYLVSYATDPSHAFPKFNAAPPHDPLNWGITLLPGADLEPATFRERPDLLDRGEPLFERTRLGDNVQVVQAFTLRRDGALLIRALGEGLGGPESEAADGSSISTTDDRTVWRMQRDNTVRGGGAGKNRLFDGIVNLTAGSYTLHVWTDDSHSFPKWNALPPWEPDAWGITIWPGPGLKRADFVLGPGTGTPAPQGQARPDTGTPSESAPSGPTPSGQPFSARTR